MPSEFYLFVFILFFSPTVFAQKYPYKLYTIKDGLSAMQCTFVFQDSRGFVWIGTKNGLNRFVGKTFKKFYREDGLEFKDLQDLEWNPEFYKIN